MAYLLGGLGSHISISELGGDEDTTNLSFVLVDLVDFEFNVTGSDIESLVIFLEEFFITFYGVLETGEGDSHIVTSDSTSALGVKEETSTV